MVCSSQRKATQQRKRVEKFPPVSHNGPIEALLPLFAATYMAELRPGPAGWGVELQGTHLSICPGIAS